ncbi:conserved protein, unknown function [Plasmodium ovale wallikeri]|uniref:Uncharacterized protein n=1 Tax=Plasmodium ovale wallikeri TaxID=864142 RepID=A0A1A8YU19_PLAOA|nr:conserved protein, unknown function [Plasmodium ovale wallikeri]
MPVDNVPQRTATATKAKPQPKPQPSSVALKISILQQFYNRLPIRKKYIKAIKKGTLIWDKGQVPLPSSGAHQAVKIPPLKIEGYDPPKKCLSPLVKNRNNQYRGKFQNLKAHHDAAKVLYASEPAYDLAPVAGNTRIENHAGRVPTTTYLPTYLPTYLCGERCLYQGLSPVMPRWVGIHTGIFPNSPPSPIL